MAWIKLDDQFFMHPKVIAAGRDARDLYLAGLSYAAGQLTDGRLPGGALPLIAAMAGVGEAPALAERLLDVGLWEETDGGWLIHDYLEYNPSGDEVRAVRMARAQAGQRGGYAKAAGKTLANDVANAYQNCAPSPSPSPYPVPVPAPTPVPVGVVEPAQPARVSRADADAEPESTPTPTTGILGLVRRTFDPGALNGETPNVVTEYVGRFGEEKVRDAILMMDHQAPQKRGWPYVKAILTRWEEEDRASAPPGTLSPPGNGHGHGRGSVQVFRSPS